MNKLHVAAGLLAIGLSVTGCEAKDAPAKPKDGTIAKAKAKVPAKPVTSGRIQAKTNAGGKYWLLIKSGQRSGTVYVTSAAWNKCQVDRWWPSCKGK